MSTKNINIGDYVWAKLLGHVPWPALVVEPSFNVPNKPNREGNVDYYWVYFFGSHNYSWIEGSSIKPYEEFREKFVSLYKKTTFKEAVTEIEGHVEKKKSDPNYKVVLLEEYRDNSFKRKKKPLKSNRSLKRRRTIASTSVSATELYSSITPPLTSANSDEGETSTDHIKRLYGWCEVLETRNITASTKTFGVLGLGVIGQHVVRNLIRSGHKVNIWNRTLRKSNELEGELKADAGDNIKSFLTTKALIRKSDVIFLCTSDNACKSFVQSNCGINDPTDNIMRGKGLLIMTGIDPATSKNVGDMLEEKGGKYLEAQIQWGSQGPTLEDTLILLVAGDRSLFDACQSCFKAIANAAIFLGEVGYATKLNLILQMIRSVCLAGLVEGLCLADRCGINEFYVHHIFSKCQLNSDFLKQKMTKIVSRNFAKVEQQSVENLQKDIKLGLDLSHKVGQPMNVSSTANEIFKHCRRLEYGNHDSSVIYMRNRH